MKFNIARQPLIPAFLTLAALATVALWQVEPAAASFATEAGTAPLPGELLIQFQVAFPIPARILAGLMIVWTGLCVGRLSVRYGLYAVSNCLPIPLYGIIACGIPSDGNYLATYAASLLLALSLQHFCRACRNGYSFDAIFRASFYLGLLPFVYPNALPLILMMPLAVLIFQRTLRELAVATAGILLPMLSICYLCWGSGQKFSAPLLNLWHVFADNEMFRLFTTVQLPEFLFGGGIVLLTLFAIFVFLSHAYTTGSKPRFLLTYNIGVLLLCAALACAPSAAWSAMALLAIPAALFIPVLLVRVNRVLATPIYLVLLGAAVANLLLK